MLSHKDSTYLQLMYSLELNHLLVPVTMEIRRTVNGYPESNRTIPFAEVILQPEQVNISTTGNTATTFNFTNPIHLSPGEYAYCIIN